MNHMSNNNNKYGTIITEHAKIIVYRDKILLSIFFGIKYSIIYVFRFSFMIRVTMNYSRKYKTK